MARPSFLATQMKKEIQGAYNAGYYYGHAEVRAITLDISMIALGEAGYTPEQIHDFLERYDSIEHEYAELITKDGESTRDRYDHCIHDISYSKQVIDDNLKKYLLLEDFRPFEERHKVGVPKEVL